MLYHYDSICNCLWWIPGIIIAILEIICGVILFTCIIGIPFPIQHCKLVDPNMRLRQVRERIKFRSASECSSIRSIRLLNEAQEAWWM